MTAPDAERTGGVESAQGAGDEQRRPSTDETAVALLRGALPTGVAIYRFGSSVSGLTTPDSDIDLAVLGERPLDAQFRFDLQERLAVALRRQVDLVDLRAATTVMAMQVVTTGVLLHNDDPEARGRFEGYVYGAYARLNEERRGILDRVAAEGSVYGR
jgi:predicted nucleotidyltransferase